MSCQELVELVTEYLEGTLSRAERRRFEEHLDECEGCVHHVEQMRATISLVGRSDAAALDRLPGLDRLLAAFRDWNLDSA